MMHEFCYISTKDEKVQEAYQNILNMIYDVQNIVREKFTFRFDIVGSYKMNMITYDDHSNIGYDFDFNIEVNDDNNIYTPKEIKETLIYAFQDKCKEYGYGSPENSTRVITIKKVNPLMSKILHSCDFAIINNYYDDEKRRQEYIHFNKKSHTYSWNQQSEGFYLLPEKLDWIKKNKRWIEFRKLYLYNKNLNTNEFNHSRQIRAITAHQICQKYGYYMKTERQKNTTKRRIIFCM